MNGRDSNPGFVAIYGCPSPEPSFPTFPAPPIPSDSLPPLTPLQEANVAQIVLNLMAQLREANEQLRARESELAQARSVIEHLQLEIRVLRRARRGNVPR
jgi:hypothetical protein